LLRIRDRTSVRRKEISRSRHARFACISVPYYPAERPERVGNDGMRRIARAWLLAAAFGLAAGCGDDNGNGTGPSPSPLVGTWRATTATISMVADPNVRLDIVALGGTIRLSLASGGTFVLSITAPGLEDEVVTGTWTSTGSTLTLYAAVGAPSQLMVGAGGSTLTLVEEDVGFDFDDCGEDEEGHFNMTLVRE
jgi:hypothetical protein